MNDEIYRLRRMRQAALAARVLARMLNDADRRDTAAGRSSVLCWRIARIATARLRAHPHSGYHRDPGVLESVIGVLRGLALGFMAIYRQRPRGALQLELYDLSRLLDDARALTLSPELSDALGRAQVAMRQLLEELGQKVRITSSSRQPVPQSEAPTRFSAAGQGDSPYLAL